MEITVHTRHLDIPAGLRETAVEKAQHLERFLEGTQRADIVFSRDHAARDDGHVTCEISVVARGRVVRVRSSGHLANTALEAAIAKETGIVEIGKDITPDLNVVYGREVKGTEGNEVQLEYRVTRGLSLRTQVGAEQSGADIFWRHDFGK